MFARWNWVSFQFERPKADNRIESCHVFEDTLAVDGTIPQAERATFLSPMIVPSGIHAAQEGKSLALIRPENTRFRWKQKSLSQIEIEREAYRRASRQESFLDKELAELEPTPYEFQFRFSDASGQHEYLNGDWEAHAMFWHECRRSSAAAALKWMDHVFNDEYPKKGMVFALGNVARRPQTWQLLGVIRLNKSHQIELI
jgi:hypothetical protein